MPNRLAPLTSSFPAALASPARRRTFDRFELRRELGSGVTGVVWQAWDRQRTAEVALKILHRFDPALVRRFKQEFRTLADVRHRNIVRFHELFEIEERLFFSMELIDGVDLMSWVWGYRQDDALSAAPIEPIDDEDAVTSPFCEDTKPTVVTWAGPKVDHERLRDSFAQLGRGLAHLHGAGYLHRDLKPSNLMVRKDGRLMILDFGLAVSLLAPFGGDLEKAVGTIAYMAPEIAEQRTPDERADYYSFGVLLFEALTGRTPFSGDSVAAVLAAKAAGEAPRPSQLVPDVPADLDDLCHALLQRDPAQRAGAAEVARFFLDDGDEITAVTPPRIDSERSARMLRAGSLASRPPVVGRGREVERLCADLARVQRGGLCCRLVTGPSGIGKSAFASELAHTLEAQTPPVTVLRGRCHDREAIPFRAIDQIVDALAQHLAALDPAERAQVTPMRAHLLAELFPVLRGLAAEHVRLRPRDPGVLRLAAFATLRDLLRALALLRPLVLLIDDLHLADPDSLDLIAQVFLGPEPPQLLLVGLGRSGAVMDQLGRLALTGGAGEIAFERLELGPLQGEHAEQVARALASYMDVALPDASQVAADTRGHPGFTYDILRAGQAAGASSLALASSSSLPLAGADFAPHATTRALPPGLTGELGADLAGELSAQLALGSDVHSLAELGRGPLPALPSSSAAGDSLPALASVLTTRILGLDDVGRRVIELLCAVDGPCSVQLAADLLGAGVGEIAAALDELVDADLVVATGRSDDDAFELYHERIRDVAEATLGAESFAAINRTLAEALEARGDADPARLLRHWQLGGDRLRAAHYRMILAARAVSALELQRAALYHETSLRDELPPELERRIRTSLGEIYGFLGRQSDSATQLLAAAALTRGEPALELRCRAAAVLLQAVEVEAGCALIEDVLEELGCATPPPPPAAMVERITGGVTSGPGGEAGAAPRPRRASGPISAPLATALAAEMAPSVPARLVARLRKAMPVRWRPRRTTLPFQARAAEAVPPRQSLMLDALATASIGVGVLQPMRGRAYQQRHLELARQVGDRVRYLRALCAEAAWAACSGSSARERADEALARAAAVLPSPPPSRLRGEFELATAISEFHLGDFPRGRLAVERALAALDADSLGAQFELRQARAYASWLAWLTGDYATLARRTPAWAAQARDLGDRFALTLLTTDVCIAAWLLADDIVTAERQLDEAERTWSDVDAPMQRWLIASARVQLELYRGDPGAALAALEPALVAARRGGLHQVETLRVFMLHLELRTALALAAAAPRPGGDAHLERALYLERATSLRQHLASIPTPWAQALAALGNATCLELAGHLEPARRAYATAERALTSAGLAGYAGAAAWCAAALAPALPTLASLPPPRPATDREVFSQDGLAPEDVPSPGLAPSGLASIRDPERFFSFLVGATS